MHVFNRCLLRVILVGSGDSRVYEEDIISAIVDL